MLTADLQALIDDIAERLSSPAALEDDQQRMVVYSAHGSRIDEIRRDSILRRETQPRVRDWFRQYGIVQSTGALRIPGDAELGIFSRICIPIRYHGRLTGFLWLLDENEKLGQEQVRAAEEAARHAGLLMYEELMAERLASSVLAHLLSSAPELRDAAVEQIVAEGLLDQQSRVGAVVVQLVGATPPTDLLGEGLRDVTRQHARGELLALVQAGHGILLGCGRNPDCARVAVEIRDAVSRRVGRLQPELRFAIGIGDRQDNLGGAYSSYRQAQLAAQVAIMVPAVGEIARWSELGAYRTIVQLSGAQAAAGIEPRWETLVKSTDSAVVHTVETYLDLGGDAQATAAQLHLHRGTLYYRLQKAERVADIDLRNGNDRLAIHLSFKIARLLGRYG